MIVSNKKPKEKVNKNSTTSGAFEGKNLLVTAAILTIIVVLLSGFYLFFEWRKYKGIKSSEAIQLGQSLEALLHLEHVAKLSGTLEDFQKPEYAMAKDSLIRLAETNKDIYIAYLMKERNEDLVFILDSKSPESMDHSPPGTVYEEADDLFWEPFRSGETVITPTRSNHWGSWIEVLVPIKDSTNNEVIAIFGIAYSSAEWYSLLWKEMIPDFFVILAALSLYFSLLYIWIQQARFYNLNKKIALQEELYHSVFEQSPIGIAIVDGEKFVSETVFSNTNLNPMFEEILGRESSELNSIKWADITYPDDLQADIDKFEQFKKNEIGGYKIEKRFIKPNGSIVWTNMKISSLFDSNHENTLHLCLIEDISARKKAEITLKESENNLRYINEHDEWTGLYNRAYLENLLEKDFKEQGETKKALVDINLSAVQLFIVNYGFRHTQNLIKNSAEVLRQYCTSKRMLFKTYENRFVFYLRDYKDKNELVEFSESISNTLESLFMTDRISGGIGVLEIDKDSELNVDMMLRKLLITSERSMNLSDKDFEVFFYDENLEASINRESEIRQKLARIAANGDSDKLFLQYQPILDLKTNLICGFEALARLSTEKLGLVAPVEFIPIAEKTKLIIPLGYKIILEALRFQQNLKKNGHDSINISINVSVVQLLSLDFTNRLLDMIAEMHISTENISIEITESTFALDFEKVNHIVGKFKDAGLHVAIDDFGTGYSSLAREKEMNANCLKIDKYFIDNLFIVGPDKAITGDIISMAHKRGHYVIAEGVEEERQLQYLREHNCDKIQGYLISRPLDEEVAIAFLKEYK